MRRLLPHSAQNFAAGPFAAPQAAQGAANGIPHWPQKRVPSCTTALQDVHCIPQSSPWPPRAAGAGCAISLWPSTWCPCHRCDPGVCGSLGVRRVNDNPRQSIGRAFGPADAPMKSRKHFNTEKKERTTVVTEKQVHGSWRASRGAQRVVSNCRQTRRTKLFLLRGLRGPPFFSPC
jgi:hypothetical protein